MLSKSARSPFQRPEASDRLSRPILVYRLLKNSESALGMHFKSPRSSQPANSRISLAQKPRICIGNAFQKPQITSAVQFSYIAPSKTQNHRSECISEASDRLSRPILVYRLLKNSESALGMHFKSPRSSQPANSRISLAQKPRICIGNAFQKPQITSAVQFSYIAPSKTQNHRSECISEASDRLSRPILVYRLLKNSESALGMHFKSPRSSQPANSRISLAQKPRICIGNAFQKPQIASAVQFSYIAPSKTQNHRSECISEASDRLSRPILVYRLLENSESPFGMHFRDLRSHQPANSRISLARKLRITVRNAFPKPQIASAGQFSYIACSKTQNHRSECISETSDRLSRPILVYRLLENSESPFGMHFRDLRSHQPAKSRLKP